MALGIDIRMIVTVIELKERLGRYLAKKQDTNISALPIDVLKRRGSFQLGIYAYPA